MSIRGLGGVGGVNDGQFMETGVVVHGGETSGGVKKAEVTWENGEGLVLSGPTELAKVYRPMTSKRLIRTVFADETKAT